MTVAAGESVKTLSNRYGVPETAIRAANGLAGSAQPSPGARVIIPVYHATAVEAPASTPAAVSAPAAKMVAQSGPVAIERPAPVGSARMQLVKGAQPVATTKTAAAPAPAAKPEPVKTAKVEPTKAEPAKVEAKKPAEVAKVEKPKAEPVKPLQTAKVEPAKPEPAAEPVKAAAAPAATAQKAPAAPAAEPQETASIASGGKAALTDFRWPARGRVITGFGGKGGTQNDGINIALPEGTPVKAAESGTVAYAGNELKGYGNLVLIRHDNGYVTAYAHNGELKVKRGDTVQRGQTIATSGQTGNVSSPQLHFEIRKGSTPVDPLPHLGS
ncbi:peptidoglycan DD-metalloendopeptidase family protein [Alsobacter sp. R-9]